MARTEPKVDRGVRGYKHGRVPHAIRNTQLLDLAEQLFIERGYAGFTIDELCRAAGVSRPLVYEHFGSKDAIYLACVGRVRAEFEQAMLEAAANASDPAGALQRGVETFFSIIEHDPPRWSLVYGGVTGLVGPLADHLAELRDGTVQLVAGIATQYAPDAEPEQITAWAQAISGACEQVGRWWLRNPQISRKRILALQRNFLAAAVSHLVALTPEPDSTNADVPIDAPEAIRT